MSDDAAQLARALAREFRRRMLDEYVPRIARCVSLLTPEEVWRRPGPHGNAIGNLLLHLEGNTRQWILCGLGGRSDERVRSSEFAARQDTAPAPGVLVERLRATVAEAVAVVEGLGPQDLLARRLFQGRYEETAVAGVLHVLEHFSGHAGQIYAWTKQMKGVDLRHYDL
jgi:uncharacterized damage-inducible protein DinB